MLFTVFPFSNVFAAIFPKESAFAFAFVMHELSDILLFPIRPYQFPSPMHLTLFPLSIVDLSVFLYEFAHATQLIARELPFIPAAISEFDHTLSIFLAHLELSDVFCTIPQSFLSLSVLFILVPFAHILSGSIPSHKRAPAVCLIVFPVAFVDIPVCMRQFAISIGFVSGPTPFIHGSVRPSLDAKTVSLIVQPFANIHSAIFYTRLWLRHSIGDCLLLRGVVFGERETGCALGLGWFCVSFLLLFLVLHCLLFVSALSQIDLTVWDSLLGRIGVAHAVATHALEVPHFIFLLVSLYYFHCE